MAYPEIPTYSPYLMVNTVQKHYPKTKSPIDHSRKDYRIFSHEKSPTSPMTLIFPYETSGANIPKHRTLPEHPEVKGCRLRDGSVLVVASEAFYDPKKWMISWSK